MRFGKFNFPLSACQLQVESTRNVSSSRINELEEQLSLKTEEAATLQRQHVEMFADLQVTQESLEQARQDVEAERKKCKQLEQELQKKERYTIWKRFDSELWFATLAVTEFSVSDLLENASFTVFLSLLKRFFKKALQLKRLW